MALFKRLLDNTQEDEQKKLIQPNTIQNTANQTQPVTLKGSVATSADNSDSGVSFGSDNRDKAFQGMVGSGTNGAQSFAQSGKTPWSAIAGAGKNLYNFISDKNPSEYSDTEQSVIYPLQGAAAGSQFGPWGAVGGALYGLGYSFKDDLGLKDNNFLTQVLFPIGMGDGGGMKIGDDNIFDLG